MVMSKEARLFEKYILWWGTITPEELDLQGRASELEEKYFSDMVLLDHEEELAGCEIKRNGEWVKVKGNLSELDINIDGWRFKVLRYLKGGCSGRCAGNERLIEVARKYKDDDNTLLHEMIHAYEFMLPEHYKRYLTIKLYKKPYNLIDDIDRLLVADLHIDNLVHAPLFLLKSIDLDLRLGEKIGTVYGYGREDILNAW